MTSQSSREHRSAYDSASENLRLENLHYQHHLHTNNVGIIKSVSGNRADVEIAQYKIHNGEDITVLLVNVPIHVPCWGDFFIDAKTKAGDECRVHYCEREIETFLMRGGANRPRYARIHDLADAYIVPTCLSDVAVSNLDGSEKVGLLSCMSDIADALATLAGSVPGGQAVVTQATKIKLKIDGVR